MDVVELLLVDTSFSHLHFNYNMHGVLRTKNLKTDPDTEICAHLGFSVPIYYGHPIDMKMHSHESLGQHDHNDTTYTQFELWAFRHGNPCISRVSTQFFSGHLIDPKIILYKFLGQHDQNDASHTQIGPQTRKLSLIEVLIFWVRVCLNVHAYIGLYLTHACQKCFWKGRKISFSAHARSTMYGQKS
jgi:hypothetical protein